MKRRENDGWQWVSSYHTMRTVYRVTDAQIGGGWKQLEARLDGIQCPEARGRREGEGFDRRDCHEPFHDVLRDDVQRYQSGKGRGGVDTSEGVKIVYLLDRDLKMRQLREITFGKEQEWTLLSVPSAYRFKPGR